MFIAKKNMVQYVLREMRRIKKMKTIAITKTKQKMSIKAQTLATIATIVAAVALPQVLHVVGRILGVNTALGEILLPMQLPVILAGLLAGPTVGVVTGVTAPILSFALSGMPTIVMLPIITVELFGYGLCAGLLHSVKLPTIAKVLTVQVTGRVLRALVTLFVVYIIGVNTPLVATIWTSVEAGLAGIIIQLISIPLIVRWVERNK